MTMSPDVSVHAMVHTCCKLLSSLIAVKSLIFSKEKYEEKISLRESEKLNDMVSKLSDDDKAMITEKGG